MQWMWKNIWPCSRFEDSLFEPQQGTLSVSATSRVTQRSKFLRHTWQKLKKQHMKSYIPKLNSVNIKLIEANSSSDKSGDGHDNDKGYVNNGIYDEDEEASVQQSV